MKFCLIYKAILHKSDTGYHNDIQSIIKIQYILANPVSDYPDIYIIFPFRVWKVAVYYIVYAHSKFAVSEIISLEKGSFVLGYF